MRRGGGDKRTRCTCMVTSVHTHITSGAHKCTCVCTRKGIYCIYKCTCIHRHFTDIVHVHVYTDHSSFKNETSSSHRWVTSGVTTGVTEWRGFLEASAMMRGLPIPLAREAGQMVLRRLHCKKRGEE